VSRWGVAAICAGALLAGYVAGRATGSGSAGTVTRYETVERSEVISAQHVRSATDPREPGPLDLVRVAAARRGVVLRTTIVTSHAWSDSLLRRGPVKLSLVYDTNYDGNPDWRDVVFLFHGRLTSWISSLGQGVQAADVTRRSPTTITIARNVVALYGASGQAPLITTSPIGVAVVARWKGGGDRVPDSGWITVPPP
jgi:hypothetical protein